MSSSKNRNASLSFFSQRMFIPSGISSIYPQWLLTPDFIWQCLICCSSSPSQRSHFCEVYFCAYICLYPPHFSGILSLESLYFSYLFVIFILWFSLGTSNNLKCLQGLILLDYLSPLSLHSAYYIIYIIIDKNYLKYTFHLSCPDINHNEKLSSWNKRNVRTL